MEKKAFKGFDAQLTCRGHAFEVGKSYDHEGAIVPCESGFHACEYPLAVFGYYPPATSRYAAVELAGEMVAEGDKIAAARITLHAEIDLAELTKAAARYVIDRVKWVKGSAARKDGQGARVEGDGSAATATGDQGAATATGWRSAATATGLWSAATATGRESAATATGDQGAATATGKDGIAIASGPEGKARGALGCDLVLREFRDGRVVARWIGTVGEDGIKADTWYRLVDGRPVEAE